MRKALRTLRKKGYNLKHILLVGYSRAAEEYIDRILSNPQWGYVVCGILDEHIPGGTTYKGVKVLGTLGIWSIFFRRTSWTRSRSRFL